MDSECSGGGLEECRNKDLALQLKVGAIFIILTACVIGICMPLLGRRFTALRPEGNLFFVVKSFAAGVILATAFVHMLPDSFEALGNPCLPEHPWAKFPFAGFIPMMAALLTLMIDFWGTLFYQKKHEAQKEDNKQHHHHDAVPLENLGNDNLTMVSVHAHASSHALCQNQTPTVHPDHENDLDGGHHHHSHSYFLSDDIKSLQLRHRVISQVLELGIIAHSIIIGITLGTSQSPCTIRPLLAALTFHQFFEGMALGGCIAQAGYKNQAAAIMAFFFSVTTPMGIAIGIGIASSYNENSQTALIVQGVFDSMSAGILVYMSLVDLIATDFLSKKLQNDSMLQLYSYSALFLGAGAMSVIAYWA